MSTLKHPVGPQSSSVYWRRRLVVGLGLIAVLVIIFLIIVRPGSSNGEPQPTNPPKAATAAAAKPAAANPGTAAEPQAGSADASKCDPSQVTVEAITDAVEYTPGQNPQLSLTVTNTGSKPCTLDVGTAQQVFTISSGKDVYWTSKDCQTDPAPAEVTLEPGVPVPSAAPIPWDRTRSAPDTCDEANRDAAPAGGASYYLKVSVSGIESANPKQFLLY